MPPSHWCYRVWFPKRPREVSYLRHLAGLASLGEGRDSCSCSELMPSVTERSAFFVKETVIPTDDAKLMMPFQPELGWSVLESLGRFTDTGRWAPLQNQETKRIGEDRPLLLRCLSQFFPARKISTA